MKLILVLLFACNSFIVFAQLGKSIKNFKVITQNDPQTNTAKFAKAIDWASAGRLLATF